MGRAWYRSRGSGEQEWDSTQAHHCSHGQVSLRIVVQLVVYELGCGKIGGKLIVGGYVGRNFHDCFLPGY